LTLLIILTMASALSSTATTAASFWNEYNSEESFLPLYIPLVLWVSSYAYSKARRFDFHDWYYLHNFHNFGAILLGLISIYFNDDSIFTERIPILWSSGYFIVDTIDCVLRRDAVYLMHALFCLTLGLANYVTPLLRVLRMNSKATFCELSNPFLHIAKKTRNPVHFGLFAAVYTLCRIVWLPIMLHQLSTAGMAWTEPPFLGVLAFYALNVWWYYKILKILVEGITGKGTKKKEG
jgi:hypothetical protein